MPAPTTIRDRLASIDKRQDELLTRLDELNQQIERALQDVTARNTIKLSRADTFSRGDRGDRSYESLATTATLTEPLVETLPLPAPKRRTPAARRRSA